MTHSITFDTLQYAKKAREVGFTEQQAEFQAEEMARIAKSRVTRVEEDISDIKSDLKDLRSYINKASSFILSAFAAQFVILMGVMAHGFHWI
jgi:uncharacterized FlaG/YvyC family protein